MSDPSETRGDTPRGNELDADVAIEEPGAASPERRTAAEDAVATASGPGAVPVRDGDGDVPPPSRWHTMLMQIATGNAIISVLAVVLALIVGGIMIAFTDEDVQAASGYFFSRPATRSPRSGNAVSGAYAALFQGCDLQLPARHLRRAASVRSPRRSPSRPRSSPPASASRSRSASACSTSAAAARCSSRHPSPGWVGFAFDLPWGVHMLLALVGGLIGGALWAGIAGVLKARTGAHEVIVTIMLNYVAFYLVSWMLRTPGLLQAPGSNNPKTPPMKETAIFPLLLGPQYNLHFGFILVDRRDDRRVVDPQPLEPRLPVPRGRREPERRARRGHQRQEHVRLRDAHRRCAWSASPA